MKQNPLLKVMIIGDANVGKTSLTRRFCEGKFEESRVMTIGVDFQTKVVQTPDGLVKLSIWDLAGQERFQAVRENFYRGSYAAAMVYDLSNPETLGNLHKWYQELTRQLPGVGIILVGNKSDLFEAGEDERGLKVAEFIRCSYFKTSAQNGDGVEEMFSALAWVAYRKAREKWG
jgi:small GTP-binding protein